MPGASSIQDFIRDLKEGQSNITRRFNMLFGVTPGDFANPPAGSVRAKALDWVQNPGNHRNSQGKINLSFHAKAVLESTWPLEQKEIDHINGWPDSEIIKATQQMGRAITNNKPCHFSWELYDGNVEVTDVKTTVTASRAGKVVFRSPRAKIRELTALTGEVTVEV
jgi:hypothetical protein